MSQKTETVQESEAEKAKRRLQLPPGEGNGEAEPSSVQDVVAQIIEKNPQILDTLKQYFKRQSVMVGFAVAMLDMGVVSLGLTLQDVAHTPLVWLPISGILFCGSFLFLRRLVS